MRKVMRRIARELLGVAILPLVLAREAYLLGTDRQFVVISASQWRPDDTWKTLRAKSLHSWRSSEQGKSSRSIKATRRRRRLWERSCLAGQLARLVRLLREKASDGTTQYRWFLPDCGFRALDERLRTQSDRPVVVSYGGGAVILEFEPQCSPGLANIFPGQFTKVGSAVATARGPSRSQATPGCHSRDFRPGSRHGRTAGRGAAWTAPARSRPGMLPTAKPVGGDPAADRRRGPMGPLPDRDQAAARQVGGERGAQAKSQTLIGSCALKSHPPRVLPRHSKSGEFDTTTCPTNLSQLRAWVLETKQETANPLRAQVTHPPRARQPEAAERRPVVPFTRRA